LQPCFDKNAAIPPDEKICQSCELGGCHCGCQKNCCDCCPECPACCQPYGCKCLAFDCTCPYVPICFTPICGIFCSPYKWSEAKQTFTRV
jgi:hypothetical protein